MTYRNVQMISVSSVLALTLWHLTAHIYSHRCNALPSTTVFSAHSSNGVSPVINVQIFSRTGVYQICLRCTLGKKKHNKL